MKNSRSSHVRTSAFFHLHNTHDVHISHTSTISPECVTNSHRTSQPRQTLGGPHHPGLFRARKDDSLYSDVPARSGADASADAATSLTPIRCTTQAIRHRSYDKEDSSFRRLAWALQGSLGQPYSHSAEQRRDHVNVRVATRPNKWSCTDSFFFLICRYEILMRHLAIRRQ